MKTLAQGVGAAEFRGTAGVATTPFVFTAAGGNVVVGMGFDFAEDLGAHDGEASTHEGADRFGGGEDEEDHYAI